MTVYTLKQLSDIGVISQQLKRVLVLLGCSTSEDMIELSNDWIKVDYIEKSHKLKDELFKALTDVKELDSILPEFVASAKTSKEPSKKPSDKKFNKRTFKVGDYTEHLLEQSSTPIKVDDLLQKIRYYLPGTYIESIRANLNGDPKGRFIFFLDGYVGLKRIEYDKRFQVYSVENKKIQYAEQRIMEFLSFMEEKHRSPQPHGLEAEESLYRWYLDFTKSTTKELAKLRADFKQYLKEYDQWMFTPFEYSYKRNCDQVKWYVDENLELPTQEDEPELAAWFNSQLECYEKHKDKRKKMFIDLMSYLEDYGMHFYDAKSAKGKAAKKEKREEAKKVEETPLEKYSRLFDSMIEQKNDKTYLAQKALLLIAIGNLIQNENIRSNEIKLTNDLLMEFADVCIDIMGTASSFNIAIPFYYLSNESFWSLIPQMWMACEDSGEVEPTYDYIEQNYSCSIIDQDLFELFSDKDSFLKLKKTLIDAVINGKTLQELQPVVEVQATETTPEILFNQFIDCYDIEKFRIFLAHHNYVRNTIELYTHQLKKVFEQSLLQEHKNIFLEYNTLKDYKHAINKFCYLPDIRYNIHPLASLRQYLLFAENCIYGTQNIRLGRLGHHSQKQQEQTLQFNVTDNDEKCEKTDCFDYYTGQIMSMRQAKINGEVIVAKPVLLLALIDSVEEGVFFTNLFELNEWLEARYLKLMKRYTKHSQFHTPADISNPFWHLQSDGFWHLHHKTAVADGSTPTKRWLKEHVEYASFDDDLWILLQNKEWRQKLHDFIVENKLSNF